MLRPSSSSSTAGRIIRSLSPPAIKKNKFGKSYSDVEKKKKKKDTSPPPPSEGLKSPSVVQRLMGNTLGRSGRSKDKEKVVEVKVELTKGKVKETLTATQVLGSSSKGKGKGTSSSSTSTTTPTKPPRTQKEGKVKGGHKNGKKRDTSNTGISQAKDVPSAPASEVVLGSFPSPLSTKRSPPPVRGGGRSRTPLVNTGTSSSLPYIVREKPLNTLDKKVKKKLFSPPPPSPLSSLSSTSMPSLTPYLRETKRVTSSVFLTPRPTKTSLMRTLMAHGGVGGEVVEGDSDFLTFLRPRGRRRRSVSCVNLKDYSEYISTLRGGSTPSSRFQRLHTLYSSIERLGELEKAWSTSALWETPPVLPPSRKNDFDYWWKVRNRQKVEEEMRMIERELMKAQRDREFLFRPITPHSLQHLAPSSDPHLRWKKWSVEEIRRWIEQGLTKSPKNVPYYHHEGFGYFVDVYKTGWRGSSVKEVAVNLMEHGKGQGTGNGIRRAFSMSSTLTQEQRDRIKSRIGTLITSISSRQGDEEFHHFHLRYPPGGRPITTTPHGFTLSSDQKKDKELKPSSNLATSLLSERAKKEISHRISEELKGGGNKAVKGRKVSEGLALVKKAESKSKGTPKGKSRIMDEVGGGGVVGRSPFYSVYCKDGVNKKVTAFETAKDAEPLAQAPASLPPFRSLSPPLRSPSPQRRPLSSSPLPPPPPKEYVSHLNIISKLASLLLRRDTHLKSLVQREILERERLDRLRKLNFGEVDRLRSFFEERSALEEMGALSLPKSSSEVNLLRCLFCSDSNLAKMTDHLDSEHRRKCASSRPEPDGSSPTPKDPSTATTGKVVRRVTISPLPPSPRSRKPIYHPSSTPNVCQPTLTAHCALQPTESLERLAIKSPEPYGYQSLPPLVNVSSVSPVSFKNYDPKVHQPRYRWVPPPPSQQQQLPHPQQQIKRVGSALGYYNYHAPPPYPSYYHPHQPLQHYPYPPGGGSSSSVIRRAESFHGTTGSRGQSHHQTNTSSSNYHHRTISSAYGRRTTTSSSTLSRRSTFSTSTTSNTPTQLMKGPPLPPPQETAV